MIGEFLDSWAIFYRTYLSAMIMGLSLSLLGVVVVARGNVFVAAAIAQASMLGVSLSLFLSLGQPVLAAVFFSIAASLLVARKHPEGGNSTSEELTGWIFLISGSLSVLLLARMPYGLKEIQSLLSSSIIGANSADIGIFTVILVIFIGFLVLNMRRLTLFLSDPVMAAAVGANIILWSITLSICLGFTTGLAIQSSGMLFTFGCLVLPAQMAKHLCRDIPPMFIAAPLTAIISILIGLILGNHFDLPPAQTIIALMSFMLLLTWSFRWGKESFFVAS